MRQGCGDGQRNVVPCVGGKFTLPSPVTGARRRSLRGNHRVASRVKTKARRTSAQNCHRAIFHAHFSTVFTTLSPTRVRIRSHGSNTTRNSGEFPRYVYLLVIRFLETPDFPMFSISGKLRNSDVSDFRKLRTPTFSEIFVLCNHSLFMSSPFTGDSVRSG